MDKQAYQQGVRAALYDLGVIGGLEKQAGVAEIVQRLRGIAAKGPVRSAAEAIGSLPAALANLSPAQRAVLLATGGGGLVGAGVGGATSDNPVSGMLLGGLAGAGVGAGVEMGLPRLLKALANRNVV